MFHKPLLTTLLLTASLLVGCQQPTTKTAAVTYKTVTGVVTTVPPATPVVIQVTPAPQQPVTPPPIPKVNTSPWIGKSIDDIVSAIGNFRAEVDMGNGVHAFQFQAKPKKPRCVASYLASRESDDKPWIVEEYIAPDPKTC